MKYNEFVALDMQLKKEGSNINEFVKVTTGNYLFEAGEDELDKGTEKGDTLKKVTSPRFALARKKITNNAKSLLKSANKDILEKYMAMNLKNLQEIANSAVELSKDKKNPEEIVTTLQGQAKQVQEVQTKQMGMLEKAIDQLEANTKKRVDTIIGNDKLSEKTKLKLGNYWVLLSTQVKQKIYQIIINKTNEFIKETSRNNPELEKVLQQLTGAKNFNVKFEELSKKVEAEKNKVKSTKVEDTHTEQPTSQPTEVKVGEHYQYTTKPKTGDPKTVEIVIKDVGKDGNIQAYVKGKETNVFAIKKDGESFKRIGKRIKDVTPTDPSTGA